MPTTACVSRHSLSRENENVLHEPATFPISAPWWTSSNPYLGLLRGGSHIWSYVMEKRGETRVCRLTRGKDRHSVYSLLGEGTPERENTRDARLNQLESQESRFVEAWAEGHGIYEFEGTYRDNNKGIR